MPDSPTNAGRLTVQTLKGLNEREQHANQDIGFFDILKGGIPINKNTITKAPGCSLSATFTGESIMGICQTNDSRGNIIIRTVNKVYVMSEAELFAQAAVAYSLTPTTSIEEDSMSQAIIVHQLAAGVSGGAYAAANVWQQAPLSAIITQVNADGTAAAFVTLAASQMTLAAGKYRIRGYSIQSSGVNFKHAARIYNVSLALPAWNGLANEDTHAMIMDTASNNVKLEFGGYLDLAAPTILEVQGLMNTNAAAAMFGKAMNVGGFTLAKELYRYVEIIKTA